MSSFWKKQLPDVFHCPVCQKHHQALHVRMLGSEEGTSLSHATCPSCQHSFLYVLKEQSEGTISVGMITDLLPDDVPHLLEDKVSLDDILALHAWLKHPSWKRDDWKISQKSETHPQVPIDKKRKISHNSDHI
ncbi:TPA: hypothetical protein DEP34_01245 [Candidatus Uhrbacteria bacterium]|uniref:Uncharacterized protein n=2 Tax=Candidatus Uhriibacteriota TaxID=1752732 RepID=A0A0G1Q6K9_9BACT|nr:MAG: hypothetical protein UX45_C0035G0017 [Candidatus Uhrbacteria bacterium GW2011_GWF2_46_218]KKU40681.1 MAG: hypothetical protein UX57_C0012G0030 [Candidatus Uhrbacteria bacterium GW2011_GWE2_46_68]HBK34235.1 hypothetical protein [Candidatus Uhrbacteria bacterium]HCB18997.1 hypothetical protein [Candidatus Uhrbacteria bacterium]